MKFLDASQHLEALAEINAAHTDRQIEPVPGEGGIMLVSHALLGDCGPGGYWADYSSVLLTLPETEAKPLPPPPFMV